MAPRPASRPPVPASVTDILADYHREHPGRDVRLWVHTARGWIASDPTVDEQEPGTHAVPVVESGLELCVEVHGRPLRESRAAARFLATVLRRALQHDSEIRDISRELTERYEEITLLYSISETLGSVISLEEAASTILTEVQSTLVADRAALWIHDATRDELMLAAAVGGGGQSGPICVGDRNSLTAQVFRESRSVIFEPGDVFPREEQDAPPARRGDLLSVPVSYTPPAGTPRTIGVINLVRRSPGEPFSAGDLKLLTAIASQVGAAVENSRLVDASLRQQRLVRELELAHDLQLKLLPDVARFAGRAEVAARCLPASSVGGDFYQLFHLPNKRLGVVIGDVSSHGFGAALIMALTMSAVAIHASEGHAPAEVLRRIHRTLIGELTSTEMYVTLFYGVIDPRQHTITYANAGHAHVFRVTAAGETERLSATDPPLGMVDLDSYGEAKSRLERGKDLLFLLTDGLARSVGTSENEGERRLVEEVRNGRHLPVGELLERLFALADTNGAPPPDDRTAMLVRV